MARIYIGPAGIPLTLKEQRKSASTIDGIKFVREIGLNAMEVEFVQGVRMSREMALEAGRVAKSLGVRLSVHAPYFINLCSEEKEKVERSIQRIQESIDRAEAMGATIVVVHAAYYGELGPEGCYNAVRDCVLRILEWMEREGYRNVKLGIEVMGRKSQFGSFEEVLKLVREVNHPQLTMVIDWAHIFVRNNGRINYREIIDVWKRNFGNTPMHTHFTCVRFRKGEWVDEHEPIDAGNPPFEPLAAELAKEPDLEVTIISESPLLEKDALKMKEILVKYGNEIVGVSK